MPIAAVLLGGFLLVALAIAFRWPLVHDAPLMHYIVFLMRNGQVPYRDIVDMNMPGTYISEWVGMRVFGAGAFGWWLWDVFFGALGIAACVWMAGRENRSAGIAAGVLSYLLHLRDGAWNLGQRDWVIANLLLLAFAFLFQTIRTYNFAWMIGAMACCSFAASIKPPVGLLCLALPVGTWWWARRRDSAGSWQVIGYSLLGILPTVALIFGFLWYWHDLGDFLQVLHGLVPFYAREGKQSMAALLVVRAWLLAMLSGAALVFVLGRQWRRWQVLLVAAGALFGKFLFIVQGKAFGYHTYTFVAFACLGACLVLQNALRGGKLERTIAVCTVAAYVLVLAPTCLHRERASPYPTATLTSLQSDLERLGGSQLDRHVQCLDMTMGSCINVLYRMRLVQSTGFIYDFALFSDQLNPVVPAQRARFLEEVTQHPPRVIVLSSHIWPGDEYGYQQLDQWPTFAAFLRQHYSLYKEFPAPPDTAGYRLYKLSGT